MFLFTYTAAVLAITFAITAALLLIKNRNNHLTCIFALYVLASAVWMGGNAAADVSYTTAMLQITSGIAFVGGALIVSFFLVFVDTFIDEKPPSTTRLIIYFLPSVLFTIASFSDLAIKETFFPSGEPAQIVPGILYTISPIFFFSGLIYGMVRLLRLIKRERSTRRLQAQYIGIGFLGLFIGAIVFSIFLPLMGELRFFNVAPQFSVIFAISSGYAVIRHELLDIKIIIQRGLIYTVLLACIIGIYIITLNLVSIFLQQFMQATAVISAGITTIIGIFTIPHIDKYLRKKTDYYFFKDTYDYNVALHELSEILNHNVSQRKITQELSMKLKELLKSSSIRIKLDKEVDVATEKSDYTSLQIPITLKDKHVGTLFLAEKLSGDVYTYTDQQLLHTLSYQLATAFERSKLHKEVEDYSLGLEKKVNERTHALEEAQEQQRQIISDIAHGLQSPVTNIKNELTLLNKQSPDNIRINAFEKSVDSLSLFVGNLLRLAKYQVHNDKGVMKVFDISEFLNEVIEYITIPATDKGIIIKSNIKEKCFVLGDTKKLEEMILCIAGNAMKYMRPLGDKRIIFNLTKDSKDVHLAITDTGIGIPQTDLPYIFERFYRVKRQNESGSGTGLGLAIARTIARNHDGDINAVSIEGAGSTFTISLPRSDQHTSS